MKMKARKTETISLSQTITSPHQKERHRSNDAKGHHHTWIRNSQNIDCMVHSWNPTNHDTPPRGLVILFHGLGGHGMYPTVRYLAELLVKHNFCVYCGDFCGHGQSKGRRGYIESLDVLLADANVIVDFAQQQHLYLPLFLGGVSLGGAVAIALSTTQLKTQVSGLILIAPMVSLDLPKWQCSALKRLHRISKTMVLFKPPPKYVELQFRDDERKKEAEDDPYSYRGRMRIASALTCVELCYKVQKDFHKVSTPMLTLMALEDCIIDNNGIDELMEKASSIDKTLKEYYALHGMLCEVNPLRTEIENDIIEWLLQKTDGLFLI